MLVISRLGWLNLVNVLKPYYKFDLLLDKPDERVFCKVVLDFAAAAYESLSSSEHEKSTWALPDLYAKKANLPDTGVVHLVYECNPNRPRDEVFGGARNFLQFTLLGTLPQKGVLKEAPPLPDS